MPKAEWDDVADGVPQWWDDCDSSGHTYPLFDEPDELVHAINESGKTYEGEAYIMFCGKEFTHEVILRDLGKEVTCLLCLAEGA